MKYIQPFETIGIKDLGSVGGKNASLGEMIQKLGTKGVRIPSGYAVNAEAFRTFLIANGLRDKISSLLATVDPKSKENLEEVGETVRNLILSTSMPQDIEDEIVQAYLKLGATFGQPSVDVAVRSSATAEDLPDASFAGQQDSFLNVSGSAQVLDACKRVYASLFTNRAISYRIDKGFDHMDVAISIGIQKMVRSDKASSGVMFTLDTESGFQEVIFITGAYGLGENVVQGEVNPDEFYVHKPTFKKGFSSILKKRLGSKEKRLIYKANVNNSSDPSRTQNVAVSEEEQKQFCLNDAEIMELSRMAVIIENHYSSLKGSLVPMDIEWAKDADGVLYIVQARPETVYSQKKTNNVLEEYILDKSVPRKVLAQGRSIGKKAVSGVARICFTVEEMKTIKHGDIIVTDQTSPDMEPYMQRASGIVTQKGGRTSHAAIISRELGIPCIVGAENAATKLIPANQEITLDCTHGEVGNIFDGKIPFTIKTTQIDSLPELPTKIMMNVGNPDEVFSLWNIPSSGVGLARLEFIINNAIRIHPMSLLHYDKVTDITAKKIIDDLLAIYPEYAEDKTQYFIDKLAQEAGTIAATFYPNPVIIRMSDFKSNEYYQLVGGKFFEPTEENPMIGFRGASRYYHNNYKEAFALECKAMKKLRDDMGLTNVCLMLPFVRTVQEAKMVQEEMKKYGLERGKNGLEMYMMVEIPSNVILIDEFAKLFDGFSIGSNDLTQTTLGVDRDSELVSSLFDERNEAVKIMLEMAIKGAKRNNRKVGICGQGPSDYPDFAEFLVQQKIDSISLTPDTVIKTTLYLAGK